MSQKSFSSSFPYSEIYGEEIEQEIFQTVGSQDINALFSGDLNTDLTNDGPYGNGSCANEMYENNEESNMTLEDIKQFAFSSQVLLQMRPLAASEVLSNEEYVGPFDLEVSVLPNHISKNPWVYSPVLNKVFMDINQQFPVDFKVKSRPEKQLYIRTTPQYSAQHQAAEPVYRCIQHDHYADPTNKEIDENVRRHVIRCSNKSSQYVGNPQESQRLSIIFPLSVPQAGSESVRELFHFVCLSSCSAPGMNRRALEIIFTLEDEHGTVFGRKSLKVRVCACPKRDKEKEENKCSKTGNANPRGKKRKSEHPPSTNQGKVLAQQQDDLLYNINITFAGKQNLLDVLTYAEKMYMLKAYQTQGHPEEQSFKKTLAEIQGALRKLQ